MPSLFNLLVLCLVIVIQRQCDCALMKKTYVKTELNFEDVLSKWTNMETKMKNEISTFVKNLLPGMMKYSSQLKLSSDCQTSLNRVVLGLTRGKLWAFQFLDATAKPPSGVTVANFVSLGNYDLCLNISVPKLNPYISDDEVLFGGQYCLLDFRPALPVKPKEPLTFGKVPRPLNEFNETLELLTIVKEALPLFYTISSRAGICIPSTCSLLDVDKIAHLLGDQFSMTGIAYSCEKNEPLVLDRAQLFVIGTLLSFGILTTIATVFDYWSEPPSKKTRFLKKAVLAFSIRQNVKKLLNTDGNNPHDLKFIHGVKFLTICWIVFGHTFLSTDMYLIRDGLVYMKMTGEVATQILLNGTLGVETFFLIAGLLLSYNVLILANKYTFKMRTVLISRIYRILPTLMLVVGLATLTPFFGSGPLWKDNIEHVAGTCRMGWWAPLLFINNFQFPHEMCLPATWYLSVDMQLFVVAIIVLSWYLSNNTLGILTAITLILTGILGTGFMTYFMKLDPALLATTFDQDDIMKQSYYRTLLPHNHIGVYMIGFLIGILFAKKRSLRMSFPFRLAGWMACTAIVLTVVFGTLNWNRGGHIGTVERIAYASLARNGWGLAIGWILICCHYGYGNIANDILSWKAWQPFSRLIFLVYLVHYPIMFMYTSSARESLSSDLKTMVWRFFGHLAVSLGVSSVLYVIYESPLMTLKNAAIGSLASTRGMSRKTFAANYKNKAGTVANGAATDEASPEPPSGSSKEESKDEVDSQTPQNN